MQHPASGSKRKHMLSFSPMECSHAYPHASDKLAEMLRIKEVLTAKVCLVPRPNVSIFAPRPCGIITVRYARLAYPVTSNIVNNTELCKLVECDITALSDNDDRAGWITHAATAIGRLSDKIIKRCEAEMLERALIIGNQSFSTMHLETGEGTSIDECTYQSLKVAAKWVQAMLQLEGDDRFCAIQWQANNFRIFNNSRTVEIAGHFISGSVCFKDVLRVQRISIYNDHSDCANHMLKMLDLVSNGSTQLASNMRHK